MKTRIFILSLLFVVLLVHTVSAVEGLSFNASSAGSVGNKESTIRGSIILENTGDENVNVTFNTLTVSDGSESMELILSPNSIDDFAPSATQEIEFRVNPELNQSAGTYTGTLTARGNTTSTDATISVTVRQVSALEVEAPDIRVSYPPPFDRFASTDDSQDDIGNGDRATVDIYPGSEIELVLKLENTFTDSQDIEIQDIAITVTIEDLDDGSDVEVDAEEFDLPPDTEDTVKVFFDIPIKVESADYDVIIEIEAEDENGDDHSTSRNLTISVQKESHDLNVVTSTVSPTTAKCGDTVRITGAIMNLGNNEEDDAAMTIRNSALGINFERRNIVLEVDPFDEENEFETQFVHKLPDNLEPGEYDIRFKAFFRNNIELDARDVPLVVTCAQNEPEPEPEPQEPAEPEEQEDVVDTVEQEDQVQDVENTAADNEDQNTDAVTVPILTTTESKEKPLTSKPEFLITIGLFNLILFIVIIVLVVKLVTKIKNEREPPQEPAQQE